MAKYYGMIGFANQIEETPGIWKEVIEERPYYGDIIRNNRRWDNSAKLNDDFSLNNVFSVVTDTYMHQHFPAMRYLEFQGSKFEIASVELNSPRVSITVGGVYATTENSSEVSDGS